MRVNGRWRDFLFKAMFSLIVSTAEHRPLTVANAGSGSDTPAAQRSSIPKPSSRPAAAE
jgi:hypothetical protein